MTSPAPAYLPKPALVQSPAEVLGCLFLVTSAAFAGMILLWLSQHAYLHAVFAGGGFLGLCSLLRGSAPKTDTPSTSHGSAEWGNPSDQEDTTGLILGLDPTTKRHIRYNGGRHLLTVAPTGSGKGIGAVIPNLLDHPGSLVVLDLKGENHAVTARRRRSFGDIIALDPFRIGNLAAPAATFNPLDLLLPDSEDLDADAAILANLLIMPNPDGADAHWSESATILLTGFLLHIATAEAPERRNLTTLWEYLSLPKEAWEELLKTMSQSPEAFGKVAAIANQLSLKEWRELSGIISTTQRHTQFLSINRIRSSIRTSSFAPRDLKARPTTIYLLFPPDQIPENGRWLRLMLGSFLLQLQRKEAKTSRPATSADAPTTATETASAPYSGTAPSPGAPPPPVLFLLDEIAQLGRLRQVEQGVTLLRGYGIQFWLFLQDFSQLRTVYGKAADSLIANSDVLQAFGTNDYTTAEHLSKLTGQSTIRSAGVQSTQGQTFMPEKWAANKQTSQGTTYSEIARALLTPDEVRRLDRDAALIFISGKEPLQLERDNYLVNAHFDGQWDANPMHRT